MKAGSGQEIIFKEPCTNLTISSPNIQIVESSINYAILNVLADGDYVINGKKYEDKSYKISVYVADTPLKQNIINIEKATLISPRNCNDLANKLLEFYQRYNLTVEFKFLSNAELTGQDVFFRTVDGKAFIGSFVRQNMDLTGGFRSGCYIIGKQQTQPGIQEYYCANEIPPSVPDVYAGESFGLI